MNFDFSEDQKVLQHTARDYLADQCTLAQVREILESERPYDEALWKGAAEMGFLGTAVPEEYGGAGFGYLESVLVAEELGRALAPTPHVSSVYLVSEALLVAGTPEQKTDLLPRLVSGEGIGAFALAERPGQQGTSQLETTFDGHKLRGCKIPVVDGDIANIGVVAAKGPDGAACLVVVDLDGKGVTRRSLASLDPTRSLAEIIFDDAPAQLLGNSGGGAELVEQIHDRAAVLIAFEQLGGAQRCLEIATDFALGRFAFGRPIGSFQAIKHKLADMFVAVELARSNAYYGAWALSSGSEELRIAACPARIAATEAYETLAQENLQIHGGVGFTWEYDCHLFLRRAKFLAATLGGAGLWKDRLIRRLAA